LLVKNYGAKFDPTTGSVIGDPLNSVLNPAGPSVPDGESPGNVSYVLSKNGNFDGKNVYAGQ
jgi:nitrite reductase/ring-hydroxylating ferredoxin subunit